MPRGILILSDNSPKSANRGGGIPIKNLGERGFLAHAARDIDIVRQLAKIGKLRGGVYRFKIWANGGFWPMQRGIFILLGGSRRSAGLGGRRLGC